MGATKSKQMALKGNNSRDNDLTVQDEENYEKSYKELMVSHGKLQKAFLLLKSNLLNDDYLIGDDFAAHTSDLSKKLDEIIFESKRTNYQILNSSQSEDSDEIENNDGMEDLKFLISKLQSIQAQYKEDVDKLKKEHKMLLTENDYKGKEIRNLQLKIISIQMKFKDETEKLRDEYNKKSLLFCEQYEQEKRQVSSVWENKITEVIDTCNKEVTSFKMKVNQEMSFLQQKLSKANQDLKSLSERNKHLSVIFNEIDRRYKLRESRKDDLEKIADLEGQLILQSEELEKQKRLMTQLKKSNNNNGSKRNKKTVKKQQQQKQKDGVFEEAKLSQNLSVN